MPVGMCVCASVGGCAQEARQTVRETFDDVAGLADAKASVMEVVNILRNPLQYKAMGARMPAGLLLVGPPGTALSPLDGSRPGRLVQLLCAKNIFSVYLMDKYHTSEYIISIYRCKYIICLS